MDISEWYDNKSPEIICGKKLICSNVSNGKELLWREAERLGGVAGIECVTIEDIAKKTTAEYLSHMTDKGFMNLDSEYSDLLTLMTLINSHIDELEYDADKWDDKEAFKKHIHKILTRNTAEELLRIINMIRMNKAQDKLLEMTKGGFDNDAVYRFKRLYQCLNFYTDYLKAKNIYDKPRILEEAVNYLKNLEAQGKKSVVQLPEYAMLNDLVPTVLESEFLSLLGADTRIIEAANCKSVSNSFVSAYGMADEIRYAANIIADKDSQTKGDGSNKLYPGNVAIWYTNSSYRNLIRSIFSAQNIAVSFAGGLPAAEKDGFMLFIDILDWLKNDCRHDFLTKIIRNRAIEFRVSKNKKISPVSKRSIINYFSNIGYIYEFSSYERIARSSDSEDIDVSFLENNPEISYDDPRMMKLAEVTSKRFIADLVEKTTPDDKENGLYAPEKFFGRLGEFFEKYCIENGEARRDFPAVKELIKNIRRSLFADGRAMFTLAETDKVIRDIIENENTDAETSRETVTAQLIGSQRVISSRKYNFIVGMSSDLMLRKTDESPVMYDAEIRHCLGNDAGENLINRYIGAAKNKIINDSIEYLIYSLPQNSSFFYSYPNYDPIRLCVRSKTDFYDRMLRKYGADKEKTYNSLDSKNSESFLYEKKQIDNSQINKTPDFKVENMVDFIFGENEKLTKLKEASKDKKIVSITDDELVDIAKASELPSKDRLTLSTTGLETLLSCPMKFACKYIYKLKEEPIYPKDKVSWLDNRERGLFFHRVMELYYGSKLAGRSETSQLGRPEGFDKFDSETFENAMRTAEDEFSLIPVAIERIKKNELAEIRNAAQNYLEIMTSRYNNEEYGYMPCAVEYKWDKQENDDIIDLSQFAKDGEKSAIKLNYKEGSVDRLEMKRDNGKVHFVIADYKTGRLETFIKRHDGLLVQHYIYKFSLENSMTEEKDPIVDRFEFHFPFDDSKLCYHYRNGKFEVSDEKCDITSVIIDRDDVFEFALKTKFLLYDFVQSGKKEYNTSDKVIANELDFDNEGKAESEMVMLSEKDLNKLIEKRCEYCSFGEICGMKHNDNDGGDEDDDE